MSIYSNKNNASADAGPESWSKILKNQFSNSSLEHFNKLENIFAIFPPSSSEFVVLCTEFTPFLCDFLTNRSLPDDVFEKILELLHFIRINSTDEQFLTRFEQQLKTRLLEFFDEENSLISVGKTFLLVKFILESGGRFKQNFKFVNLKNKILFLLKSSVDSGNSKLVAEILSKLIPPFLSNEENSLKNQIFLDIFRILKEIERNSYENDADSREEALAVCFYHLTRIFQQKIEGKTIENENFFDLCEKLLRPGLTSKQTFVRKISRETLKSLIFELFKTNDDKSLEIWTKFINFLDVLEQKQVHLIKPALTDLDFLLENVETTQNESFSFDVSWILLIFSLGFHHLNNYIAKTLVLKYFRQSPQKIPSILGENCKFFLENAFPCLNDGDLYHRCLEDKNLDEFLLCLQKFFAESTENVENARIIFRHSFLCSEQCNRAPVPLFFLFLTLSRLKNAKPIWNEEILPELRRSFFALKQISSPSFRLAVQEDAVNLCVRLIDWNRCSFVKFARAVFPFIPAQIYARNSRFFNEISSISVILQLFLIETEPKISIKEILSIDNEENFLATVRAELILKQLTGVDIRLLIFDRLSDVHHRPYVNFVELDAVLKILVEFLSFEEIPVAKFLSSEIVENIEQYILRRLGESFKMEHLLTWNSFEFLINLIYQCDKFGLPKFVDNLLNRFAEKSSEKFIILKILYPCIEQLQKSGEKIDKFWPCVLPFQGLPGKTSDLSSSDKNQWQKFISEWRKSQWLIINRLIMNSDRSTSELIDAIIDLFDEVDDQLIPTLLQCLSLLVSRVDWSGPDLIRLIDRSSKISFELSKSDNFTSAIGFLVSIMLGGFLQCQEIDRSIVKDAIVKVFQRVIDDSQQFNALCVMAAREFASFCDRLRCEHDYRLIIDNFQEILIDFGLFGSVLRKDQKTLFAALKFLAAKVGNGEYSKLIDTDHLAAQKTRIYAIKTINRYLQSCQDNMECQSRLSIVCRSICNKIVNVGEGKRTSKYFPLSLCHRTRTRGLQFLLVVSLLITDRLLAIDLINFARDLLTVEGQLGSVRILLEILIIRLCLAFPALINDWLKCANDMGARRIGSLCSWLQIVMHILLSSAEDDSARNLFEKSVQSILPFCTAQNFTVRCVAQSVLKRIWSVYRSKFVDVDLFRRLIDSCVEFSLENRNATRHVEKQLNDFYFLIFDVRRHFTISNLFCVIPKHCHMPDDEIIDLRVIKSLIGDDFCQLIAVENQADEADLESGESLIWDCGCATTDDDNPAPARFDAIQTKANIEIDCIDFSSTSIDNERQLIVVASLIDRPTNLGGLCRTCEIFGASEYAIGSLKYLDDALFQNLSVSSERWVKINEVKPGDLEIYLKEKRRNGFSIVGVEQTTKSQDLRTFQFPQKTLLLLGNEKEGIPPFLLSSLDFCVVIPQTGVVRSLNVHVAGAMLIWEYAKQHRF